MDVRQERLNKLFNEKSGNSVMIPMDHGIMLGACEGLMDPIASLKKFVSLGADALLLNFGVLKLAKPYLDSLEKRPGILMGVDFNQIWNEWKTPIEHDIFTGHTLTTEVALAAKYGVDCVKVLFPLGLEPKVQLDYITHTCMVINEADKYDMPVLVEPTTHGSFIADDMNNDAKIVADGCRVALELGADILKIPYPGHDSVEELADICANAHVPVVMLGGPKEGGIKEIFVTAQNCIDSGAKGTIFGRKVWNRPEEEMEKIVKGLQEVINEGANADEVYGKYFG